MFSVRIIGCGASTGVPVIGCNCEVCTTINNKPKNKRRRTSIFVENDDTKILVDSGPDYREQILELGLQNNPDGVLYTHAHSDHINGIDDLRCSALYSNQCIDIYSNKECIDEIKRRFPFVFIAPKRGYNEHCYVRPNIINPEDSFSIKSINITAATQIHGLGKSLCYIFKYADKVFVYSTDFSELTDEHICFLKDLNPDLWIPECIGYANSFSHSTFEKTIALIERVKPKRAILTHMSHEIDYYNCKLPANVEPAYDGMHINI